MERKGNGGDCVFLESKQCSIHAVKPAQCATYPFWPQALASKADWCAEATRCEGITFEPRSRGDAQARCSRGQTTGLALHHGPSAEVPSVRHLDSSGGQVLEACDTESEEHHGAGEAEHIAAFQRPTAGRDEADHHVCKEQVTSAPRSPVLMQERRNGRP